MNTAQITKTNRFGKMLYDISKLRHINTVVEIGTYTGEGSTRCIIDGLLERPDKNYNFTSIELDSEFYKIACENLSSVLSQNENIKLLNGKIINSEDIYWFDHDVFFSDTTKKKIETDHAKIWFDRDINNLNTVPNILDKLPAQIDLLVLDGGEYTTYPEFKILKDRTRIFALDDTMVLKCKKIREELIKEHFVNIFDDQRHRNGSAIFLRPISDLDLLSPVVRIN